MFLGESPTLNFYLYKKTTSFIGFKVLPTSKEHAKEHRLEQIRDKFQVIRLFLNETLIYADAAEI